MPIKIGTVVMSNRNIDIFLKFKFWKMLPFSITKGRAINNIKGTVKKDKAADIAVKQTDNAIFAFANFVI